MHQTPGLRYQQALDQLRSETSSSPTHNAWFAALGITDLHNWDPRTEWEKNEWDSHFYFPLGLEGLPDKTSNNMVTVDLSEGSIGGAGPHGALQGITGSGKSTLLSGSVLGACTRYSPSKLNFVLLDFCGGYTFRDFGELPHVVANVSSLAERSDVVFRIAQCLNDEIARRGSLMAQYNVTGIIDYRTKRADHPDLYPPLPELVVVVDELREFIKQHPQFVHFLVHLVTVGRSLGVHLILGSQILPQPQLAAMMEHLTFKISLRVGSPSISRSLLGVDDAARLPIGRGAALLSTAPDAALVEFSSFDATTPMPDGGPQRRHALLRRLANYTVNDLGDRSLADVLADPADAAPGDGRDGSLAFRQDQQVCRRTPEAGFSPAGLRNQQAFDQLRSETSTPTNTAWFDALSITDIATFDPQSTWEKNEWDSHFCFPVGLEGLPDEPSNSVVTLDLGEPRIGGTGPHGVIQGMTGSGKSTLLSGVVLGACTRYSPSKLNFVLLDFCGGYTFRDFDKLPHVVANVSSLTGRSDVVFGVAQYLNDEIDRREALMAQYRTDSVIDYRKKRAHAPDCYPPLPEVVVVVDEAQEFIREHPEFVDFLARLVTAGRALGMHLIWCTQNTKSAAQLVPIMEHWTFGISLRVNNAVASKIVLNVEDAIHLPIGRGAALLHQGPDDILTEFRSFDTTAPVPGEGADGTQQHDALLRRLTAYTADDCGDPTLADALVVLPARPPHHGW